MKIRFILVMNDLVVHGKRFERVIIDFEEETTPGRVRVLCEKWKSTYPFLIPRMEGLYEVGKSSLALCPVEEK